MCLVWVDTETTGLNPSIHEIIEIGIIRLRGDTLQEIDRYHTKISPEHIETADERALLLNHYSEQAWRDAPKPSEVANTIANYFGEDHIICGHNIEFDIAFIEALLKSYDLSLNYAGIIDTKRLVKALNMKVPSYHLGTLCQKFGIEQEKSHSAMSDIAANVELFKYLRNKYSVNLNNIVLAKTGRQQLRVTKHGKDLYF